MLIKLLSESEKSFLNIRLSVCSRKLIACLFNDLFQLVVGDILLGNNNSLPLSGKMLLSLP